MLFFCNVSMIFFVNICRRSQFRSGDVFKRKHNLFDISRIVKCAPLMTYIVPNSWGSTLQTLQTRISVHYTVICPCLNTILSQYFLVQTKIPLNLILWQSISVSAAANFKTNIFKPLINITLHTKFITIIYLFTYLFK